ncbi:MAG: DUF5658 family protein [Clostridium sp.]|uniref:DUF5658 family protein n=1 Tax=Clostridium sp. TaxID=1506 RepID=UPI003F2D17B2
MIAFIKNNSYRAVTNKLKLLYLLNVTDIIFTLILIKTGLFEEVNSIVKGMIDSPLKVLFLKIIFIGILLYILIKRMEKATEKQLRIANIIITIALICYLLINILHIIYIISIGIVAI